MGTNGEIGALRQELAILTARLAELEADHDTGAASGPVSRRGLMMGLAGAGAAAVAGLAGAEPAAAADGETLKLGQANSSSLPTTVESSADSDEESAVVISSTAKAGLLVSTQTGLSDSNPHVGQRSAIVARAGDGANGVWSVVTTGFAVYAENQATTFPTVAGTNYGTGPGIGGASVGNGPQLFLEPHPLNGHPAQVGPPTAGQQGLGALRLDIAGDLWVCTADGTPGTWTRFLREDTTSGRVVPIAPTRVLDSRATGGRPAGAPAVPGQVKGPLKGGQALTLDLAGHGPIPADATAVIGNLTVTAPSYGGYLIARPTGSTSTSSALNWAPGATTGNAFTCQLGPAGLTLLANGSATQHYELIVDLTAYIT